MGSAFGVLRHAQFRLIWIGLVVGSVGGAIAQFALGWLLVTIAVNEGRPELASFYIGLVSVARGGPGLVFGLLGGVFADRVDRRLLMVVMRAITAGVAVALAAMVLTDRVSLFAVIALSALAAISDAMDLPVRQAVVARLLPPSDLVSAQGLGMATWSTASIVGPLVGAALIGPIGIGGLLLVNTVSALGAMAALRGLQRLPAAEASHRGVLRAFGDGFVFVARHPVLGWVVLLSSAASLLVRPISPLLPAFAANELHVGSVELGWLLAAAAGGSLVGGLLPIALRFTIREGPALLWCIAIWGLLTALVGLQRDLVPALLLVAWPLVCWSAFAGFSQVLIQAITPDRMRGRALSIYGVTIVAVWPFGTLVMGSLGTLVGVGPALVVGGAALALLAPIAFAAAPGLRAARVTPAP
ncbi:MAG: MFS transporter [Alphaproteobacteria bacterium]|nr:MFS transporter [Alphaproteobacteria bacterium]